MLGGRTPRRANHGPRVSFGGFLVPAVQESPLKNTEEERRSFEEWLKISADNKINVSNTWNLALIDYFADMTLLRDGDSINFQKASCTLDGCIKIYTSRIDSVDSETKKLLSGLYEKAGSGEIEEETNDAAQVNTVKQIRRKNTNTLEANIDNLSLKSFDLEFEVDPLFKKTAADFDEGGAKGLLLNHLCISNSGKIIFDTSDQNESSDDKQELFADNNIEISIDDLFSVSENLKNLWSLEICPSFANFKFCDDDNLLDFDINIDANNYNIQENFDLDMSYTVLDDHQRMDGMDMPDHDGFDLEASRFATLPEIKLSPLFGMDDCSNDLNEKFAYFDKTMNSSWAGPQFWKARFERGLLKPKHTVGFVKRRAKESSEIDFLNTDPIDENALFAPSSTSINLSKSTLKAKDEHLLPVDLQFNSKRFTTLFLKPTYSLKLGIVSKFNSINAEGSENSNQAEVVDIYQMEQPENKEPQMEFDVDFDNNGAQLDAHGDDNESIDDNLPFHNESIPPAFSSQQKVEPLSFSKKAKRVDVQKLKENIWNQMGELENSKNVASFSKVVQSLDDVYTGNTRKDVSVPYCFICLLHLANEQDLSIASDGDLRELNISKNHAISTR